MAKNFLYRIVFPELRKCYFGRAKSPSRYKKINRLGERFYGPHHNSEVQQFLNQGEIAFWIPVKEFETYAETTKAESYYLDKVWLSGHLEDRPPWMLNRRGSKLPDAPSGWNHSSEAKSKIGEASKKQKGILKGRQSKEAISKRWDLDYAQIWEDVETAMANSTGYHWGGAEIARKHRCSRRFISGVSKQIREGIDPQEWIPS